MKYLVKREIVIRFLQAFEEWILAYVIMASCTSYPIKINSLPDVHKPTSLAVDAMHMI